MLLLPSYVRLLLLLAPSSWGWMAQGYVADLPDLSGSDSLRRESDSEELSIGSEVGGDAGLVP